MYTKEMVFQYAKRRLHSAPTSCKYFSLQLPPGAVSMFGGLPPPVFNNGTLQPAAVAQTASFVSPSSLVAKPDTQISSNSSVEGVVAASGRASSAYDQDSSSSVVVPSQKREEVNHRISASQPSHDVAVPGRSQNINNSRRGSLSGSGVGSRYIKTICIHYTNDLFY